MSILDALRGGGDSTTTLYECRNCGYTLSEDADECSECGSAEIASYTF